MIAYHVNEVTETECFYDSTWQTMVNDIYKFDYMEKNMKGNVIRSSDHIC